MQARGRHGRRARCAVFCMARGLRRACRKKRKLAPADRSAEAAQVPHPGRWHFPPGVTMSQDLIPPSPDRQPLTSLTPPLLARRPRPDPQATFALVTEGSVPSRYLSCLAPDIPNVCWDAYGPAPRCHFTRPQPKGLTCLSQGRGCPYRMVLLPAPT